MFREQIEAGAEMLNKKVPEWIERIDLEELDLCEACNCIVGQVFPEQSYGVSLMKLFHEDDDQVALYMAHHYGFAIPPDNNWEDYEQLTQEWKEYILERIG